MAKLYPVLMYCQTIPFPNKLLLVCAKNCRQPISIEYYDSSTNENRVRKSPKTSLATQIRVLRHPRALGWGLRPFSALGSILLALAYLDT